MFAASGLYASAGSSPRGDDLAVFEAAGVNGELRNLVPFAAGLNVVRIVEARWRRLRERSCHLAGFLQQKVEGDERDQ